MFFPTNFYWYSLMWNDQDLGDDQSPVHRAVRSRGHGSKQTQVSTVEHRAALRTFLGCLVSLHKLQHLFYHEPRFDQVKTEYDYNRRLAWDLERRWARSLTVRLLFIWNNNLIAKNGRPTLLRCWTYLMLSCLKKKRTDEMRGRRMHHASTTNKKREKEEIDSQNERGHWAQQEHWTPLSRKDSCGDGATYLLLTSGKY